MDSQLISVVMPLYNNANELQRAVDSVLAQSYSHFELIVVNDGSTDASERVVRGIHDTRIRIVSQKNKGVSAARNRGVAEAQGKIVAFLDADDEWKPDFLETVVRLHRTFPECAVFATGYLYKETDGGTRSPILHHLPQGEWEGILQNYFEAAAHSDPPLWSSAVAVKKQALLSVGGFPEGVAIGEDLLTWARLAALYAIAFSKKQCAVFWLRGSLTGYPTRNPEIPDLVGEQFLALASAITPENKKGFYRYLSMWHRMRASMFIQLNDRPNAIVEVRKMAEYSIWSPHLFLYTFLVLTPRMMRKVVVQFFTLMKTLRRRLP